MKKTIGVIGLGSIGMRHAKNLTEMGHYVIGFDPNQKLGGHWPIKHIDECEAVIIASPTPLHAEHLAFVNITGKPIFVEKPIADTLNYPSGNIKMVGYNLRFHPCVMQAKEWIDDGLIGDPIWANFTLGQFSEKPPYLRDGVILNWSHEIDLALHLLGTGTVRSSTTVLRQLDDGRPHDTLTDISFLHHNACLSTIHLDYHTKPEVRQTIIVGDKGRVIFDLVRHNAWLIDSDGNVTDQLECGADTWDRTYIDEMKTFLGIRDWSEKEYEPKGCTAEEGLEVLKICLEVRKQAGLP